MDIYIIYIYIYIVHGTWQIIRGIHDMQGSYKQGFVKMSLCLGPFKQNVGSLCLCGLLDFSPLLVSDSAAAGLLLRNFNEVKRMEMCTRW